VLLQASGNFGFGEASLLDAIARAFHIGITRYVRFIQVIDSCSIVAIETQMKYGT